MEETWGFLAPWFGVFSRDTMQFEFLEADDDIWGSNKRRQLTVLLHNLPLEEFRQTRDALALLAAVEHVDKHAWKFLLARYCYVQLGKDDALIDEEIPVRYSLYLDTEGRQGPNGVVYDLVEFCGVSQREHPSIGFDEALGKIAAVGEGVSVGVEITVPVRVLFHPGVQSAIEDRMAAIAQAERTVNEQWEDFRRQHLNQHVPPRSYRCAFVLEPMVVFLTSVELSTTLMKATQNLIRDNVRFSHLAFVLKPSDDVAAEYQESRSIFSSFAAHLFGNTRRHAQLANTAPLQLGAIELLPDKFTRIRDVEAIFSAMVSNQTTNKIVLCLALTDEDQVSTKEWWKWVAYGVFSKRARLYSAVESLELLGLSSMSKEDMEAFAAIATSNHPEEDLFSSPRGILDERDATLKIGTPIQWLINNGEGVAQPLVLESDTHFVRTFSDDGESQWVDVVIPGLGRCHVQRSDLVFDDTYALQHRSNSLTSLQLGFNYFDFFVHYQGVPLFLSTVGSSLESLVMQDLGNLDAVEIERFAQFRGLDLDDNWILHSCPNLRELSLFGGHIVDVSLSFDDYHKNHRSLCDLSWCEDATAFVQSLSDANNPRVKYTRRLRVHTYVLDQVEDDSAALGKAILEMLRVNQRLEYFELDAIPRYWGFSNSIRAFHLQPISRVRTPLAMESKLAFLSAISCRTYEASSSKRLRPSLQLPELNQAVLQDIFTFAATPVLRQVYFHKGRE